MRLLFDDVIMFVRKRTALQHLVISYISHDASVFWAVDWQRTRHFSDLFLFEGKFWIFWTRIFFSSLCPFWLWVMLICTNLCCSDSENVSKVLDSLLEAEPRSVQWKLLSSTWSHKVPLQMIKVPWCSVQLLHCASCEAWNRISPAKPVHFRFNRL